MLGNYALPFAFYPPGASIHSSVPLGLNLERYLHIDAKYTFLRQLAQQHHN